MDNEFGDYEEDPRYADDVGESPGSRGSKKKPVIIAVVVALVLAVAAAGFFLLKDGDKDGNEEAPVEQVPIAKEVRYEEMKRLSNGTILTFGNPSKQPVTLIVDPAQIGRQTHIIGGKPSDLLTAVQKGKIRLNLYITPSSQERSKGVASLLKAATCRINSDRSSTNIFTLVGIVNAGDKLKGDEDIKKAAKLMGVKGNIRCAHSATESYTATSNNAKHFLNSFQATDPGIMVSGGQRIDDFNLLKDGWVEGAINGAPAGDLITQQTMEKPVDAKKDEGKDKDKEEK